MKLLFDRVSSVLYLYKVALSLIILLVLFFQVPLNKLTGLPNFFDEIVLFGILLYSLLKSFNDEVIAKILKLYMLGFITLFCLSVPSIPYRGLVNVLLQVFIHLKYILFFSFIWFSIGHKYAIKFVYLFLSITTLFLLYNLISGSFFNELFKMPIQVRAGTIRPVGVQADTASLGTTFAVLGASLIAYKKNINVKLILLFLISALILLTTVRSAMVLIPLVILWWLKDSIKSFAIVAILLLVVIVPMKSSKYLDELVDITSQNIEWTVDNPVESGYIRGIMIFFSFELANNRFPIGTGAATFGTVMSDDSHIYAEIGMQNSRFFIEKEGIYDSNFASILGEFGYLGLLFYYWLFYNVIRAPQTANENRINPEFQFIFFLLICAYSIATPVFMNTYPALLMAIALTSAYRVNRTKK